MVGCGCICGSGSSGSTVTDLGTALPGGWKTPLRCYNVSVSTAEINAELSFFHSTLRRWFLGTFEQPTNAQAQAWPVIADGKNTLLLARQRDPARHWPRF